MPTPTSTQHNPYYPSKFKTGDLDNEFRLLFDHMYAQQRRNTEQDTQMAGMQKAHGELSQQVAAGPSNTKIMGIPVTGTVPKDGQVLTYSAKVGGFIFE